MAEYLRVRNWERYQHYKAQRPAWIKLYTQLHDDPEYITLEDREKAHMIGLLLLAGRTGNKIPDDSALVTRMIHATTVVDIPMWISRGFLVSDCGPKPCINTSPRPEKNVPAEENRIEKKDLDLAANPFRETPLRSHPRSTSIPDKDPAAMAGEVVGRLSQYWPESRPGAGANMAIRTWRGRLTDECILSELIDLEAEDGWRELSFAERKRKIGTALNHMLALKRA